MNTFPSARPFVVGAAALLLCTSAPVGAIKPPVAGGYAGTIGKPFPIATTPSREMSLSVAAGKTNYLVGIQGHGVNGSADCDQGHDAISAQLLSFSGARVGNRILVGRCGSMPVVAFDGANYLLVWSDAAENGWPQYPVPQDVLYGQFIGASGALVGTPFRIAELGTIGPIATLAYGAGTYLVAYSTFDPLTDGLVLRGKLISPSGVQGREFAISGATDIGPQYIGQGVAFDGSNFVAIWMDSAAGEVRARFVSPAGAAGRTLLVGGFPAGGFPTAAIQFGTGGYLIAWMNVDPDTGAPFISGRVLDASGSFTRTPTTMTSAEASPLFLPCLAFDGRNFLLTWTDMRTGAANVYARLVDGAAVPITAEFAVAGGFGHNFLSPTVYNAGRYLVAWTNSTVSPFEAFDDGDAPGDVIGTFVSRAAVPDRH